MCVHTHAHARTPTHTHTHSHTHTHTHTHNTLTHQDWLPNDADNHLHSYVLPPHLPCCSTLEHRMCTSMRSITSTTLNEVFCEILSYLVLVLYKLLIRYIYIIVWQCATEQASYLCNVRAMKSKFKVVACKPCM